MLVRRRAASGAALALAQGLSARALAEVAFRHPLICEGINKAAPGSAARRIFTWRCGPGKNIGLVTVYRALGALAVVRTARGETLDRRCGSGHHHYQI